MSSKEQDVAVQWPIRCPECGDGKIVPCSKEGRSARYKNVKALALPADLEIPTCNSCGLEWIDSATAAVIDNALAEEFRRRLRIRAVELLAKLASQRITQRRVEELLGLSQGYLSKVRSGVSQPSPTLVECLQLLANDPEQRIHELELSFDMACG